MKEEFTLKPRSPDPLQNAEDPSAPEGRLDARRVNTVGCLQEKAQGGRSLLLHRFSSKPLSFESYECSTVGAKTDLKISTFCEPAKKKIVTSDVDVVLRSF